MLKKFFAKGSVLKIVSFLIAILVWLYVNNIEDPKIKVTIDDVPVKYKTSELSEKLALISHDIKTIDVEVEASRSEIIGLDENEIEAYLDLSGISDSGDFDNVKIKVSSPNRNINVIKPSKSVCSVRIDDIIKRNVDVEVEQTGNTEKGYAIIAKTISSVDSVEISGPKKYVDSVKGAYIKVSCDGLAESKEISSEIVLIDDEGEVIDSKHEAYDHIKLSDKKSTAYVSVGKTQTVNVVISGAEAGMEYSVSPSTVEVYSEKKINKIYTENISGELSPNNKSVKVKLVVPEGVTLLSEKNVVTVNLKND